MRASCNSGQVRVSAVLVAGFVVAAIGCFGYFFFASNLDSSQTAPRPSAAVRAESSPEGHHEMLAELFVLDPTRLDDDDYVAAALAWDKQLLASRKELKVQEQQVWERVENHYIVYDAMVQELKVGLKATGDDQPLLREALANELRRAREDLPVD